MKQLVLALVVTPVDFVSSVHGQPLCTTSVCAKCCCLSRGGDVRPQLLPWHTFQLHWLPVAHRIKFKVALQM